MEIKKTSEFSFEIKKAGKMNVPVVVYASENLLEGMKQDITLEQAKNVAMLPGIVKASFVMPDAHQGYGFSIGGVAGFDLEKGIVSPGGVGYDINCGVRVLATDIDVEDFLKKRKKIIKEIYEKIPSGVGEGHKEKISEEVLNEILINGVGWAIENGFGEKEDLERCEEYGKMGGANPKDVSQKALARGKPQVGTLGAGNHFLEIQKVDEILDEKTAKVFGIEKNKIVLMIHCGSRGLGHQVASDYIKLMEREYGFENLPDRELINAPIKSDLGKKYFSAMACAVNYAFCNRQMIMHQIREILKKHFPENKFNLVYDVAHNIAKIEEYFVDGKKRKLCIHRKGATRAFGPSRKELPKIYKKTGQPVILPGSMGTASYILVGTDKSDEISFGSTAHGAGRLMSRNKAISTLNGEKIKKQLEEKNILIEAGSVKGIAEEAPQVYKDIEEVAKVSDKLGIAKKVARLVPLAVIKG